MDGKKGIGSLNSSGGNGIGQPVFAPAFNLMTQVSNRIQNYFKVRASFDSRYLGQCDIIFTDFVFRQDSIKHWETLRDQTKVLCCLLKEKLTLCGSSI